MIGKRIQALRKSRGWSLNELSERSGVAKSYLSMIERDKQQNPSIQVLEKLSHVFQIPLVELLPVDVVSTVDSENPYGLDEEWLEIAREAKLSGIDIEEFKQFVEYQRWKKIQDKRDS
ncbi:helix-turn-helix domain-containing protein [Alicyclobacillus sp. TC]|uniref:XRE family transcriptional regulator of biofilm formation n=1 Tax=Alicyclobacillus tolerans TaxID=90970 RepID=A0ABT9LZE0_9BACL|nr:MULTISPECIES: helix-turn-helix domain-containing protein [Alicyclobacillus]MDP9729516.1 XRE family transcriptional regulator of biofilm formation [Alicyclobacillus tengchongensis]QRF24593.1 helix-turn-helix domain-containing protein [Alicyclobacillus sp. TC]